MTAIRYHTADVDGFHVFYREAGAPQAPKLLLLHGFRSAGHMFRELIPRLDDRFHIIAPDLPGFGRSPDGYSLDNFYMSRPGADELQLDLLGDYKSNVALYPTFQAYFRTHKPPLLAVWGKNDPFFLSPGAEAFKRDIPDADVRLFETGRFALETHCEAIAAAIRDFLSRSD
jgi:pimeloyl-ACP methyl ester carboxylesterase